MSLFDFILPKRTILLTADQSDFNARLQQAEALASDSARNQVTLQAAFSANDMFEATLLDKKAFTVERYPTNRLIEPHVLSLQFLVKRSVKGLYWLDPSVDQLTDVKIKDEMLVNPENKVVGLYLDRLKTLNKLQNQANYVNQLRKKIQNADFFKKK
ncbi:hypothetical protein [Marinicella sp. W31]|uniref:hypothetical protein n=1 Tax=Marinicella sp. W31 TaxID=3023713 RepID=UPI0037566390